MIQFQAQARAQPGPRLPPLRRPAGLASIGCPAAVAGLLHAIAKTGLDTTASIRPYSTWGWGVGRDAGG